MASTPPAAAPALDEKTTTRPALAGPAAFFVPDFASLHTASTASFPPTASADHIDTTRIVAPTDAQPSDETNRSAIFTYFDVTTDDIKTRLLYALLPYRMLARPEGQPEPADIFRKNPDFYGPFWICVTNVFALFVGSHAYAWASEQLVTTNYFEFYIAALVNFLFWICVPAAARGAYLLSSTDSNDIFKLDHLICVYGYSLLSVTPMALLCALPSKFLQVLIAGVALAVSFAFLAINLLENFMRASSSLRVNLIVILALSQLMLFLLYLLYFF